MTNISQLVDNQLPEFFVQEYPLFVDFFKQYYRYTEIDNSSSSILKKIQTYQGADFYKDGIILETILASDVSATDTQITLSSDVNKDKAVDKNDVPIFRRFPKEGLLLLKSSNGDEIVQYKSYDKNTGVFSHLKRGAAGTVKLGDLLLESDSYTSTDAVAHSASDTTVTNITHLFLASLFKNLKTQYFSGLPVERLNESVNVPTVLKYIKDFYRSKGTSPAVEFLFRSSFNDEKILVRYPNEQLIKASESTWSIDTIVQGDLVTLRSGYTIDDLSGLVLKQSTYAYDPSIIEASASIERIVAVKTGDRQLYRIFVNSESTTGTFSPINQTLSRVNFSFGQKSLVVDSTVGFPEINGVFYIDGVIDQNGDAVAFTYAEKTGTEFYGIESDALGFTTAQKNTRVYSGNVVSVVEDVTSSMNSAFAEFRPTGVITDFNIVDSGLLLSEGDKFDFVQSGVEGTTPIETSWSQNAPGNEANVNLVSVSGQMDATYLQGNYRVTKSVNGVYDDGDYVYVSSNGFPDVIGSIGNINGGPNSLLRPASQRHLKKIPKQLSFAQTLYALPDDNTVAVSVDGVPIISPTGTNEAITNRELVTQGEVTKINVTNGGSGYSAVPRVTISGVGGATGTATISNGSVIGITITSAGQGYTYRPEITISTGSGAVLQANFGSNNKLGDIQSLDIVNSGSFYTQTPDIEVVDESGRGRGAKFIVQNIDPVNGNITSIKKVSGGFDYDQTKTKIYVVSTGTGASAEAEIRNWHRDNYAAYTQFADDANGYPFQGRLPEYNDAYYYVGNPRGYRITKNDNITPGGVELPSDLSHSPIVAWSYDGVPIYGPVGYSDPMDSTSDLKRVESSYYLRENRGVNGPTAVEFTMGTFVEDYEYKPEGNALHKDLDKHNGRFCVTPDFPEGRYCYFLTIHTSDDVNQKNRQDARPRYPYMIGPTYKYNPEDSNFTTESILPSLPSNAIRIRDVNDNVPNFGVNLEATVTAVSSGTVDSVIIENPGNNYSIGTDNYYPRFVAGDKLFVDDTNTEGVGFSGKVASIIAKNDSGSDISVSSISYSSITGNLDVRKQILNIAPPTFDGTNFQYNKIFESDTIVDTSKTVYNLETAIPCSATDTVLRFREANTSNVNIGDTVSIQSESVYIGSAFTNSVRYAYLSVATTQSQDPVSPQTDQGFFYKYEGGKTLFDEIYVDSGENSTKVGKILEIDTVANVLKVEMYIDPDTQNYYSFPALGTGISNQIQTEPRYSQNVSSIEYVQEVTVVRGYDGSNESKHPFGVKCPTQVPTATIDDYKVRLQFTGADPSLFVPGVYIKGQNSDTTARIELVETISATSGYLYLTDVKEGPNAADVPRFGIYNNGSFNPETINEIGAGVSTTLTESVDGDDTVLKVVNSDLFYVNRYVNVGSELMRITDKQPGQLTVARAQGGTPADDHSVNTTVSIANHTATTAGDTYQLTVSLENAQRFSSTSTFNDNNDDSITINTVADGKVLGEDDTLTIDAQNYDRFALGDIIKIGTEQIRIDSKRTNLLRVTRGFNQTTAIDHNHNVSVENVSKYDALVTTNTPHDLIDSDLIEITGDPSSETVQETGIAVRISNGQFEFNSVHTNGNYQQNPTLTLVYGHKYVFDVSDSTNANTTLGLYSDKDFNNEISVERIGVPGLLNSKVILKNTNRDNTNIYYNNPNALISSLTSRLTFIDDPYNVSLTGVFDLTTTTFKYLVRSKPEGNARGTKTLALQSHRYSGKINRISITDSGDGYQSLPVIKGIYFREEDAFRGTVITDDDGTIQRVDIDFGGTRYISPKVYVIGNGSGASMTADVLDNSVRRITINNGGFGYDKDTQLVLVEEDARTARILPQTKTIGKISAFSIKNPGLDLTSNYTMAPQVRIPTTIQVTNINGEYRKGETAYQGNVNNPSGKGIVESFDTKINVLKLVGVTGRFVDGETVVGYTSSATSNANKVNLSKVSATVGALTTVAGVFTDEFGKMNTASQKIQDSYFYQDFSYVIRSSIPVSDWRQTIKTSTHPAGFVVFGEVIIDSSQSVAMLPVLGEVKCPANDATSSWKFDTRTEISNTGDTAGALYLRNAFGVQVGDALKYRSTSQDEVISWNATNLAGDQVTGRLVHNRIYHVLEITATDQYGTWIKVGQYHPSDKFADAAHNKENYVYNLVPTAISYKHEFRCDSQNPKTLITINILKNFVEIEDTRAQLGPSLKTIQINKFFQFNRKRGIGSLIVSEGSVAVDLKQIDDLTPTFVEGVKMYDLRSLGTNFIPYNENTLIITLDGVVQEPGKSFSIINDRKLEELEITTTGAGELEFDSWRVTNTSTNAGIADVRTVYNDLDFVYIKAESLPSYTTVFSGYTTAPSAQGFIRRFPKKPFAPVEKTRKPLGTFGTFVNGVQIYNVLQGDSYKNRGDWNINHGNWSGNEDTYNGLVDSAGTYFHYNNPIELRRQLSDNISPSGTYTEATSLSHSPILGWAYDGTPIYGPYGYSNPDEVSSIVKIDSSYSKRSIATRNVLPDGTILPDAEVGPPVNSVEFTVTDFVDFTGSTAAFEQDQNVLQVNSGTNSDVIAGVSGTVVSYDSTTRLMLLNNVTGTFADGMWIKSQTGWAQINSAPVRYNLGYFAEDYVYTDGSGHLDQYNGRFCVTPEFPEGRYCYFSTIESTTPTYGGANNGAYPYIAGVDMYHRFYEENRLRASELRDKIVFNDPPLKYTDPINGQVNVQRFQGRLFSFVDDNNNQEYTKKYKDISSQFDGNKTTFNLELTHGQALYAPDDAAEANEYAFVCVDGIPQVYGEAYTINEAGNTITFTTPPKRIGKVINMSEVTNISQFADSEIVVGQTTQAQGKVLSRTPSGYEGKGIMKVEVIRGDFQNENIVGQTSNTTGSIKLTGTITTGKDRFLDAANLIEANKQLIAEEAVDIMLDYTAYRGTFSVPGGNQNCIDDVIDVIGAVVNNLRFGGNDYTWDAANLYATGGALQHLVGEEEQSKLVFRWAKDLCVLAMQNRLGYSPVDGAGYPTNPVEDRFVDAANLITSNKDFIANEAVQRMLLDPANSGFSVPGGTINCVDDVKDVLDSMAFNMRYGGNSKVWDSANFYATTDNLLDEEDESIEVFNHARAIAIEVINNIAVTVQGTHGLTQTFDNTITVDPGGCANVQSAITTYISIITSTIGDNTYLNGVTRTSPKAYPIQYNGQIPVVSDSSIIVDGSSYTASCANIESAIYTLFDIVINTITTPTSLSAITRTSGKGYVEKVGFPQEFFAFANGKYSVLDSFDTSLQDNTTFLLKRSGELIVPTSSLQVIMMVDGVIQEFGKSYVLNEALIEFYEPVRKGSKVVALYWYGKDLEKILQGYNMPLYEPNFIKRNLITGAPITYTDPGGFTTNKLIRSIKPEDVPVFEYLDTSKKVQIDGEAQPRTIFSVSNRDIIQWETDDTESNTYSFDASNINTVFRKVYLDEYTGTAQTSDVIEPGTRVTYNNNGNPDVPGLTGGQQYYVGYRYPERAVLFYNDYQTSLSSDETYSIAIGTSTGVHSITIPSDLYGLRQANITTSDYGGITRGQGADLVARVRWTATVASTASYAVDTLLFAGGETVAKVIQVISPTEVEIQMFPDRAIALNSVVTTDLGGSNPQTVTGRVNGRVVAIEPVQGAFPIGSDYETAPVIIIRPAKNDYGRYASAYSQINRNNQLENCVVTSEGEEYYEVPDVLVSREYDVITPVYPTVKTAGYLNFWTSQNTQISVSTFIDARSEVEIEILRNIDVGLDEPVDDQVVTLNLEPKILDDFITTPGKTYSYNGPVPFEEDLADAVPATVTSVGLLRLTPTFSLLEEDRFALETSFEIGSLDQFQDLTIGTVSDRYYSSVYKDLNNRVTRYNMSPITSTVEAVATLTANYQVTDSEMSISSVAGFNRLYVEGTTFWIYPGAEIYNEVTTELIGRVERIIDSNTWVIQLERGKQLTVGQGLTYAKNTVKVTEVADRYGYVQFAEAGKVETVRYGSIDWTFNKLTEVENNSYPHSSGVEIRTAYEH